MNTEVFEHSVGFSFESGAFFFLLGFLFFPHKLLVFRDKEKKNE